ncbi:MAG: hypothetical protein LBD16_06305 [Oscillospiraceae bacterium]|jgi:hypothetical protein|nr:hypothetical protein [Oscillospiraceae bacterium]
MQAQKSSLTSKDLNVLQEQMDAEFRANRKAYSYSQTLTDPALKGLASTIANNHKMRFDALYSFLGGNNK